MTDFLLRPWRREDEADLVQFADDPGLARNLTDGFPQPYSLEDARAFIASADQPGKLLYCIEIGGRWSGPASCSREF